MENASKALIIAGGILIAMLVIGVLVVSKNKWSSYQDTLDQVKLQEQTTEFNQKFEAYNKKVITGFQIISLYNMVTDYNSDVDGTGYKKITLEVKWYGIKKNSNTLEDLVNIDDYINIKQFKQKYFTCEGIEYDEDTGRVEKMSFYEITKKE